MYLTYAGITEKHVIFSVSFRPGQWRYNPSVNLGGLLLRPEAIQAPTYIPGGEIIGAYTVPEGGLRLDYAEYDPFFAELEGASGFWNPFKPASLLKKVFCRDLLAYYLLPEEEPEELPEYPATWDDKYGYRHFFPDDYGGTGDESWRWIAALLWYEGVVVALEYVGILMQMPNTLPANYHDGRTLCLAGGGIYPLIPRNCIYPDNFAGITNFCISTNASWDEEWNHGYGHTLSERLQLSSLEGGMAAGFETIDLRDEVTAFQFFAPDAYATEFCMAKIYTYSGGFTPRKPLIKPTGGTPPPPYFGEGGKGIWVRGGGISIPLPRFRGTLTGTPLEINEEELHINAQRMEIKI
jgi:hypothetical protein